MNEYKVIGIMSGSSLDGLDICAVTFTEKSTIWSFTIHATSTTTIPDELTTRLRKSDQLSSNELNLLDIDYGQWIADAVNQFITENQFGPNLIGIHGHTVFHDPVKRKISVQIGDGNTIASITGIEVVDNFRMQDIMLGGQGAPLVPVGEKYLFPDHNMFLNLGGICNVSIHGTGKVFAWDIAPCNQVFNHFANLLGQHYDENGELAKTGNRDESWLEYLHSLEYFKQNPPKSLSNQWTQEVLKHAPELPTDALHTYSHFLTHEITEVINKANLSNKKVLITGGGAYNQTLIDSISEKLKSSSVIEVPESELIEFKEALIFGFLALLRKLNIPNVLSSVTGAQEDSVSGDLHNPPQKSGRS